MVRIPPIRMRRASYRALKLLATSFITAAIRSPRHMLDRFVLIKVRVLQAVEGIQWLHLNLGSSATAGIRACRDETFSLVVAEAVCS